MVCELCVLQGHQPMSEVAVDRDYLGTSDMEKLTGTKASTWRYWASIGKGPASFRLGRRRVWKRDIALAWLAEQQKGGK